jgi:BirA family transcriptional regulator, biotin operon repressor / biotin---[acetyl-CoA-carboxylase] ligase
LYKIPANTLFMGQQLVFMPECHSTNPELQRLIQEKGSTEGLVVITNNQTAGRGQRGNTWESEPGKNLTFSIGLHPVFLSAKDQFHLNIAISLGLFDCLCQLLPSSEVKIKWPNDCMVDGKKICGVLIENQIVGLTIEQSVIGIGLNVNQLHFTTSRATSMALASKREFTLHDILETLLGTLEKRYLQLRAGKLSTLKMDYLEAMFRRGEEHPFKTENRNFKGVIVGINESGKLAVQVRDSLEFFDMKQIQFIH